MYHDLRRATIAATSAELDSLDIRFTGLRAACAPQGGRAVCLQEAFVCTNDEPYLGCHCCLVVRSGSQPPLPVAVLQPADETLLTHQGLRNRPPPWLWLPFAACIAVVGCAGGRSDDPDPALAEPSQRTVIPITVNNDLAPRASATIWLRGEEATRILGSVAPGRERTFNVDWPEHSGQQRLAATMLNGKLTSESFSISANSAVRWKLADNALVIGQQPEKRP